MYRFIKNSDPREMPPFGSILDSHHSLSYGLIGRWLMNEYGGNFLFDLSRFNDLGTLNSGAFWGSRGLQFDGVDSYVLMSRSSILANLNTYTLSLWFNADSVKTTEGVPYSEGGGSGVQPFLIVQVDNDSVDGNIAYSHKDNANNRVDLICNGENLSDDKWHHIAVVRYAVNSWELFIDGASKDTDTTSIGTTTVNNVRLGHMYTAAAWNPYKGVTNNYSLYNRGLDASEVAQLYAEPYANILIPQYWFMADFGAVAAGWTGKICGVTNPSKICGIDVADIAKVCGV